MPLRVAFDGGFKIGDAAEGATADGLVGDQAEETLDLIDRGGRGRREMQVETVVAREPGLDYR